MTTTQALSLPQQLDRLDNDRLRAYQEHLDFYRGHQWPASSRRRERRLTFNYAKTLVDKLASYLITDIRVAVEPTDPSPQAAQRATLAQRALRQAAADNHLEQLDFDTELDASVLGDGCYKVTWDPAEQRVRISSPDVQGIFAWWVGDDVTQIWRIASRYRLTADEAQALYAYRPPLRSNGASAEVTVVEAWTARDLQLWLDNTLIEERPNPYHVIPFVLFPNIRLPKRFWGESDLASLLEPARELNRALSQLSTILELSGNPIAVLEGIEQAHDIAVQPGAVWELPEHARAYLLDLLQGGGIKLHVDYIDLLYRTLHDLAETPRIAFGDNPRALSGVALEMELHPLLQRVRRKRRIRAAAYKQRNDLILRILERHTAQQLLPVNQHILWGPLLPQDRASLVHEERTLVEAGLHSRRRAMTALGIDDPDAELADILHDRDA